MANDFSADPRVKALYRFENNLDDGKGGNHLTGSGSVSYNATDKREGGYAADLEQAESDYAFRADVDLDVGFPLKSGDSGKKISVCFWLKPESYINYSGLFTKWNWTGNKRSLEIQRQYATLKINCGHTDGIQYQNFNTGISLNNGEWYHVAVCLDGKTAKSVYVRVFRASNSAVSEFKGTLTNELWVGDAKVVVGAIDGPGSDNYFDGLLDEMVVFNELLSVLEIDAIRTGTYAYPMTEVRVETAGAQVAYTDQDGFVRVDAACFMAAYGLFAEIGEVQVNAGGLMVAYGVAPPPRRVFPVPHPKVNWQSHFGKRKFPVVG